MTVPATIYRPIFSSNSDTHRGPGGGSSEQGVSVALRDILVHLDQSERGSVRLRLAVDLAARHGSRLTALYTPEMTPGQMASLRAAELGLASAEAMAKFNQTVHTDTSERRAQLQAALTKLCGGLHLDFDWQEIDGLASIVLPQYARLADLCVVGQDGRVSSESIGYEFSEQLLFVTGRPVLLVPAAGMFSTLGRHIAVAWNASRAASRALHDALPLIERAEKVTVLAADGAHLPRRPGALPVRAIIEHLHRHGVAAELVDINVPPDHSIAAALLAEAQRLSADLLVSGAFGHPRLWEKLLGGVTQDLLRHMNLPVMMSH
ncbi:MAG TPA: universal stress protein [Steroidobacteraceae bacterium]|jgi:nucleotide-binding universal stress UspA family protein|nr:universal stress protein [Steroidobacteraceae bacterium]